MCNVCVCVLLQALGFGTGLTWGAITVAWHPENPVDKRGKYVDVFTLRAVGTVVLQPSRILGPSHGCIHIWSMPV